MRSARERQPGILTYCDSLDGDIPNVLLVKGGVAHLLGRIPFRLSFRCYCSQLAHWHVEGQKRCPVSFVVWYGYLHWMPAALRSPLDLGAISAGSFVTN
jgi:hypothetical protein